jgi:ferredoxin--NADP+ reductase
MTDDHFRLWLRPETEIAFKPGQYVTIGIDGIERPYSIASAPHETDIELFIERIPKPEGHLTPLLHELKVGDQVTIRPRAKGIFVLNPDFKHHVMVSTVTGVVPFVSMVRAYLNNPVDDHHFYLLEGASYADEFGYDDELASIAAEHPEVAFFPSVSRPDEKRNAGWAGETGRINTRVEKYLDHFKLSPEDTLVYACGHPQMIEDVRERLSGTGFAFTEERFWKEEDE